LGSREGRQAIEQSTQRAAELLGEHAAALNQLGIALTGDSDYAGAEAVLKRALAAARSTRSDLERFIQGNLAIVREDQGDLAGARALKEQVLEAMRRRFGADHPETWTAMNNLAFTRKDRLSVSQDDGSKRKMAPPEEKRTAQKPRMDGEKQGWDAPNPPTPAPPPLSRRDTVNPLLP
jgi:hypothetical protein